MGWFFGILVFIGWLVFVTGVISLLTGQRDLGLFFVALGLIEIGAFTYLLATVTS